MDQLRNELKSESERHQQREEELNKDLARVRGWLESKTEQQYELERDVLCLSGELNRHDEDTDDKVRHLEARCQTLMQVLLFNP